MVAVLPLHTFFFSGWISWKPYLVLLVALAVADAWEGWQRRSWPWHRPASLGLALFLLAVLVSWPGTEFGSRFTRLFLALGVGGALLLVTERALRPQGMTSRTLRTIFWSGAAMGATAIVLSLVALGAFGEAVLDGINGLPGVARIAKPTYLDEGFVALTNWHQDPGYAAAWMNLWMVLCFVAVSRGLGSGRRWLDAAVIGSLGFGSFMTFSRTGWLGLAGGLGLAVWLTARDHGPRDPLRLAGTASLVGLALLGLAFVADREGTGGDLDEQFSYRFDQGASLGVVEGSSDPFDTGVAAEPDYRSEVWPEYVELFEDDPLLGAGLGVGWATEGLQEPHNLILELLGETGLIGFAGFALLLGVVIVAGGGTLGALALITAFLAAFTQTVLFEPTWWFAAGLLLGGTARRQGSPTRT